MERFIEINFNREITFLEDYMYGSDRSDIKELLLSGLTDSETKFIHSGQTYRWIVILRVADKLWSSTDSYSFIRLKEEGIKGGNPHIIVNLSKR